MRVWIGGVAVVLVDCSNECVRSKIIDTFR